MGDVCEIIGRGVQGHPVWGNQRGDWRTVDRHFGVLDRRGPYLEVVEVLQQLT